MYPRIKAVDTKIVSRWHDKMDLGSKRVAAYSRDADARFRHEFSTRRVRTRGFAYRKSMRATRVRIGEARPSV